MQTLTALPDRFRAGTTVEYFRAPADYPVGDGWTLTLRIRGRNCLDVTATDNGDGRFKITLSATATSGLAAGGYQWVEEASKAGTTYEAGSGTVEITPNLATAGENALRSQAEKDLDLVNAAIERRLTKDMENYSIEGVTLSRAPLDVLIRLRASLEAQVARERNPGTFGRQVGVAFTRPEGSGWPWSWRGGA